MFGALTDSFQKLFSSLSGKRTLTEENVGDAVRQVRLALLDADVHYGVVSQFIKRVKEKALGEKVVRSVTPGQQFVELIHQELTELMGSEEAPLELSGAPTVVMLCGLQGAGKTTQSVKLAHFFQKKGSGKKVLLAACDLQRPAAVLQLKKLGESIGVPVFSMEGESDPVRVAGEALKLARLQGYELLIVDTAGRLAIDEALMEQLESLKRVLQPQEVLFVASAATGQDAVKTAAAFDQRIQITGTILTMLDGTARAGAAISIREVTGKPLKFEGVGERVEDLQIFHPRSMAERILGMGDVVNLVRKAKEVIDEKESQELEKKIRKATFTYDDYQRQMKMVKKMGSLKSLLKMMPGMSGLSEMDVDEKEFHRVEAMIGSMTPDERMEKVELAPSRRRRIALGSGTSVDDVNRMVKGFKRLKQFCKEMPGMFGRGKPDLSQFR